MPALLRIFTRVNLLVMVVEDKFMASTNALACRAQTDIRFPAAADRLEVYEDIMGFFWSCANAFPVLTLVPAFLYPSVVLLIQ